ncbi:hypothetical protein [Streptomyces sp. NPDC056796]|uniref:hypothetical protein n=1 Tax=Streptomyces sp. NPDC056796 TaxID=3345947 RepID=UPI003682D7B7
MSLAFVALLSTVGCVSVQADASRPAPAVSARSGNSPTPHASPAATAPAAVHDSLARTEEGPERAREERRRKREDADRRADVAAPSRAQAPDLPPRAVPVHPRAPRRPGVPHRLPPKRTYDMRAVCATGQGIASAELVDLCRSTYGR